MKKASSSPRITNPSLGVFDHWGPWVLLMLTVAIPLVFDFSLSDTFDLPKMLLIYIATLVLFGLWFWQQTSADGSIRPTGVGLPIFIFLGVALLSCWTSIDLYSSLYGAYRNYVYGWIPMACFALLFFLTSQIEYSKLTRWIIFGAIASGALAGLYGILQYTGNEIFELMPRAAGGRIWSSLGNPLYFGAVCMMALPLALHRRTLLNMLAALLLLAGLVITMSRSAWIGSVTAVVYLLWFYHEKIKISWMKMMIGIGLFGILGLTMPQMLERFSVLISTQESSNLARIEGWKGGIKIFAHYPLLGTGPDTFFEAFRPYRSQAFLRAGGLEVTQAHAHNELIQFAATLGFAGLAAWIWVILAFLKRVRIRQNVSSDVLENEYQVALVASLAAIFVQNQFNPPSAATAAWTAIFAGLAIRPNLNHSMAIRAWPVWLRGSVLVSIMTIGLWAISIPWRADRSYKAGVVTDANSQLISSLSNYEAAVRLKPDIETYQNSLGNAARSLAQITSDPAYREKLWNEAWQAARESAQRHPANPDAWNDLGVADMWLTQLGGINRMADAKAAFEKATVLDPVFVDAWANMAKWYHIAGDLAMERQIWKVVLRLDPQHPMALHVLGTRP